MRHELVIFLSPSVKLERSNMAPGGKQTDRKTQVSVRHNHSHPLTGLQLNRRDHPAVTEGPQYSDCSKKGTHRMNCGLLLVRPEVLRSLRHYLRAQSQGHHTIDRLEERGVERGSVRRSLDERGPPSIRRNWNRFKGSVGETCDRWGGALMGFSERIDTTLN